MFPGLGCILPEDAAPATTCLQVVGVFLIFKVTWGMFLWGILMVFQILFWMWELLIVIVRFFENFEAIKKKN